MTGCLLLQCHSSCRKRMLYRQLQLTLHLMKIKGIRGDILGVSILLVGGVDDDLCQKRCDILRHQKDVGVFAWRTRMIIVTGLVPTPGTNPRQTYAGVSHQLSLCADDAWLLDLDDQECDKKGPDAMPPAMP